LSLVGEGDDTVSGEIQVDQRQLLGISEPEPVVAQVEIKPAEGICTIRTRRGADVVEISIPCTN
jgi:pilus assembly protein CpaB